MKRNPDYLSSVTISQLCGRQEEEEEEEEEALCGEEEEEDEEEEEEEEEEEDAGVLSDQHKCIYKVSWVVCGSVL